MGEKEDSDKSPNEDDFANRNSLTILTTDDDEADDEEADDEENDDEEPSIAESLSSDLPSPHKSES